MVKSSNSSRGLLMRSVAWIAVLGSTALGTLLTGAVARELLAEVASARAGAWAAAGIAIATAVVIPAWLDLAIARRYRRLDSGARTTLAETLPVWNLALVALLVVAFPVFTRAALERHGGWMWFGGRDNVLARLSARAGRGIPRSEPTASLTRERASDRDPQPLAAPTAANAPSSTPNASAAPMAMASSAPGPLLLDAFEKDQTSEEVFRTRAASVVLIELREGVEQDNPLSKYLDQLGLDVQERSGSGFFVGDGLIVTNDHVMRGAESARVTTYDAKVFDKVSVLVASRDHDLALVRVDGARAPALPLLPEDADVRVGSGALAIGSPLGLDFSLTEGIISGKRKLQGTDFLQMQTPIAPGSSGGPLLNRRGQLIGVNTAGVSANLNLAVHVRHVHALLGAQRNPRELAPFTNRARVVEVTTIGAESSSIDRMSYAQVAQILASMVGRCVKSVPSNASITFTSTSATSAGEVESNLEKESEDCLSERSRVLSPLVAMLLTQLFRREIAAGKDVGLGFVFEGVGAQDSNQQSRLTMSFLLKRHSP